MVVNFGSSSYIPVHPSIVVSLGSRMYCNIQRESSDKNQHIMKKTPHRKLDTHPN